MQAPPFIMEDVNGTSGETRNGIFYGFLVDMMELLAASHMLNFSYTMTEVSDGFYGSIDPETNNLTGMVETLVNCVRDKAFDIIIVCQYSYNSLAQSICAL